MPALPSPALEAGIAALLLLAACGGGGTSPTPPPPPPGPPPPIPVASVGLSQATAALVPQQTATLVATPMAANGAPLAGRTVTWQSSVSAVATVTSDGLVTALAAGSTVVTATSEGKSASASVEVKEGAMIGPAGGTVVANGGKLKLTIPAGALATTLPISVAPVAAPTAPTSVREGTAYQLGPSGTTFAAPVTLTIEYPAAQLDSFQNMLAGARLTNGNWEELPGSDVDALTRTVSFPTTHFSTFGVLEPALLWGVDLQPKRVDLFVGQSASFTATALDQYNRPYPPVQAEWAAETGLFLAQEGNLVTALAPGGPFLVRAIATDTWTCPKVKCFIGTWVGGDSIWVTSMSWSRVAHSAIYAALVEIKSVVVTPMVAEVPLGQTLQLEAQPRDSAGGALGGRLVTWATSNAAIASVSTTGLVTASSPGQVTITATSEGISGTAQVTVTTSSQPVTSVTVAPQISMIEVGTTLPLTATARDAANEVVGGRPVTWTSNDPAVASVSAAGVVTAVAVGGPIGILATVDGVIGVAGIEVTPKLPVVQGTPLAGWLNSCVLRDDGTTWCWGRGASGQLGTGTVPVAQQSPVEATALAGYTQLTLGGDNNGGHSCGLNPAGQAFCWGINTWGQLGNGSQGASLVPVPVSGGRTFSRIVAGRSTTCALDAAGDAWCWGINNGGHGTSVNFLPEPTQVVLAPAFVSLAMAGQVVCGLTATGEVWCWGRSSTGQLGDGVSGQSNKPTPAKVVGNHIFTRLTGGLSFCGLKSDNSAWCWGENTHGQVGDGSQVHRSAPVPVSTALRFSEIAGGESGTCALAMDQTAHCWGLRSLVANFGTPGGFFLTTPTAVPGGRTFTGLAVGFGHACARGSDAIWCWGSNPSGELGSGLLNAVGAPPAKVVFPF